MKSLIIVASLALLGGIFLTTYTSTDSEYELYLAKFGKSYNSVGDYEMRKALYYKNKAIIEEENSMGNSYTLAMNKFGDWTDKEYRSILGFKKTNPHVKPSNWGQARPRSDATIDWEAEGVISPVKDQGGCGSCWAFSAVGALEGAHAMATGTVQQFSEQQLVDCSKNGGNAGCDGGEMYEAFPWYTEHGACFEEHYPYEGKDLTCRDSACTTDSSPISSSTLFEKDDPSILHEQLQLAPHSLGVEAGNSIFRFFSHGEIDSSKCGHELDHGVLLVGYIAERDAWKVKNSWSAGWGEDGYVYIKDNHKVSYGYCGVNMEISRPVL